MGNDDENENENCRVIVSVVVCVCEREKSRMNDGKCLIECSWKKRSKDIEYINREKREKSINIEEERTFIDI